MDIRTKDKLVLGYDGEGFLTLVPLGEYLERTGVAPVTAKPETSIEYDELKARFDGLVTGLMDALEIFGEPSDLITEVRSLRNNLQREYKRNLDAIQFQKDVSQVLTPGSTAAYDFPHLLAEMKELIGSSAANQDRLHKAQLQAGRIKSILTKLPPIGTALRDELNELFHILIP